MPKRTNASALNATLRSLDLSPGTEAVVQAARSLAAAVDDDPSKAALWSEYRSALGVLMEVAADGADDESAAVLELLRTPVPHAKDA